MCSIPWHLADATSFWYRTFAIHASTQAGFPAPDPGDKKFNSRLVAPTILQEKPFGENVEGHCGDQSYAIET